MSPELRVFAKLFTATHLRKLAWRGWSEAMSFAADSLCKAKRIKTGSSIATVFDSAFHLLRTKHPVEYVYKSSILRRDIFDSPNPESRTLYMEFRIAGAKADMLFLNGDATIYEVKTRFDNLARLTDQLKSYYTCFKDVYVIVEKCQSEMYLNWLPHHVGVLSMGPDLSIQTERESTKMTDMLDPNRMFQLFRKEERRAATIDAGVEILDTDPTIRHQLTKQWFSGLGTEASYQRFLRVLQARERTDRFLHLCGQVPKSLQASVYSYNLREKEWRRLLRLLPAPPTNGTPDGWTSYYSDV